MKHFIWITLSLVLLGSSSLLWGYNRTREPQQSGGSLSGTSWIITYTPPGEKQWSYRITFLPNGHLKNEHPNEATPDNDLWEQDGQDVVMYINDNFVIYKGSLVSDTVMRGTASNVNKKSWSWEARLETASGSSERGGK